MYCIILFLSMAARITHSAISYNIRNETLRYLLLDTVESTSANEQYIFGIHRNHLLVGKLASLKARTFANGAFSNNLLTTP